jgi:hypothetical protein
MTVPQSPYRRAAGGTVSGEMSTGSTAPPRDAGPYADVGEVSVGELVGNVTRDLSTLMRQEFALAQVELKAEARSSGLRPTSARTSTP